MTKLVIFLLLAAVIAVVVSACATSRNAYETAPYTVQRTEGDFEIRDYPALKVASTKRDGDNSSFMRLFRYIDGGNEQKEKISMTTPVLMANGEMNFVVPEKNKAAPPAPSGANVVIKTLAARRVAVYRYSGRASRSNEERGLQKLKDWLGENKQAYVDEPVVASYDPPWTLPGFRRNEVLLPLK